MPISHRIWNQTVTRGTAFHLAEFVEACETFFGRNERPCLGLPEPEDAHDASQDFLISQTPVPRKISTTCQRVIGTEMGDKLKSCRECLKLMSSNNNFNVDCKPEVFPSEPIEPKVEIMEEEDEYEDDADYDYPDDLEDERPRRLKSKRSTVKQKRLHPPELAKDTKCPWCEKRFRRHAQDTMLEHKKKQHFWGEFRCSRCQGFQADFARDLVLHTKVQ